MSYRIVYNRRFNRKFPVRSLYAQKRKQKIYIAILVGAFLLSLTSSRVRAFLLPGDGEVTQAAISNMIADIRDGEKFSDAVTTFCLVILENAQNEK